MLGGDVMYSNVRLAGKRRDALSYYLFMKCLNEIAINVGYLAVLLGVHIGLFAYLSI